MSASTLRMTPEALLGLARPEHGRHYELSDGELVIVGNAGALHASIKTRVFETLTEYRLKTKSERAFAETQFTLRGDRARIPDLAWVTEDRLDLIPAENRAILIAPDLAIQVISESEQPEETERRLRDYLEAGSDVWQVFPSLRTITAWRRNQGFQLEKEQVITSERLPGFAVPVSQFFLI